MELQSEIVQMQIAGGMIIEYRLERHKIWLSSLYMVKTLYLEKKKKTF